MFLKTFFNYYLTLSFRLAGIINSGLSIFTSAEDLKLTWNDLKDPVFLHVGRQVARPHVFLHNTHICQFLKKTEIPPNKINQQLINGNTFSYHDNL